MATTFDAFLTAFDPSDLPGGSVDPLGFDRAYTFLADGLLPGLTNVASAPRYFSVLCAGVSLAQVDTGTPPRALQRTRREAVLRLERLWALANVLAGKDAAAGGRSGIRGITYAREEAARLVRSGATAATPKFKLLSRQEPYGVLGIYGTVAEGMRLIDRAAYHLTPDSGERLAEAFRRETELPRKIERAVREQTEVDLASLAAWGARAAVEARPGPGEASCLRDALLRDPTRARTSMLLSANPPRDGEDELTRLHRIARKIGTQSDDRDLGEVILAILPFEACFRLATLALQRLLWLCRNQQGGYVAEESLSRDAVLQSVAEGLASNVPALVAALDEARSRHLARHRERMNDIRAFLEQTSAAGADLPALAAAVQRRHQEVQHAKFDQGRRKMPWLERNRNGFALTSARVGGIDFEATTLEHVPAHAYRTLAADAMILAGGVR